MKIVHSSSRRLSVAVVVPLALTLLTGACARVPATSALAASAPAASARVVGVHAGATFSFDTDTFAFPNEIRARHAAEPDLYANYCFVMARSLRQFFTTARFDPASPKLAPPEYVARVKAIVARPPWEPPLPDGERITIPGYANLRDFSRGEEAAVKTGLGGRFWTLVHWTNWRVTLPVTGAHQDHVAREIVEELRAGRLVQLLVTNWPKPELNHTVVAFGVDDAGDGLAFHVWDPNDPAAPGLITFDRSVRHFVATHLFDTEPGTIRVFRMGYSWLL